MAFISTDTNMAPVRTPEERLTALESYVGQMLGNLSFVDAALTETSIVGHLVQQIEMSMKSLQVQIDGDEMILNQTRNTLDQEIGVMKASISTRIEQMKSDGNLVIMELQKELHTSSAQQEQTKAAWKSITDSIQLKML